MNEQAGRIEEYESLREEIMRRQYARWGILGFTVAGIGTLTGLALSEYRLATPEFPYQALYAIGLALFLLIGALVLTRQHGQQIDIIAGYIRTCIEPNVPGMAWESCWKRYRGERLAGTGRSLAVYYAVLACGVYSACFAVDLHHTTCAFIVVSVLFALALFLSIEMVFRFFRGWKDRWKEVGCHRTNDGREPESEA